MDGDIRIPILSPSYYYTHQLPRGLSSLVFHKVKGGMVSLLDDFCFFPF